MKYEIVCAGILDGTCGFRVHDRYFVEKRRFAPGICPRNGMPTIVVRKGTNDRVNTMQVSLTTGEVENIKSASEVEA